MFYETRRGLCKYQQVGRVRVDLEKLRGNLNATVQQLVADPAAGWIRATVTASLVEDVTLESQFVQYGKPFAFSCDEAVERAGQGRYPRPLRYFLSSVAFCQGVWCAKGSAVVGCHLESLEVDVETFLDMRGDDRVGEAPAYPQVVDPGARVDSPSPPTASSPCSMRPTRGVQSSIWSHMRSPSTSELPTTGPCCGTQFRTYCPVHDSND